MPKSASFQPPSAKLSEKIATAAACVAIIFIFNADKAASNAPNYWREGGNNHGLTDLTGKEITPAISPNIEYIGHGLFLLSARNPSDWLRTLENELLINQNGVEFSVKVPYGTAFKNIFWLGNSCEKDRNCMPNALADDALIVFKDGQGLGICDKNGKAILPFMLRSIGLCREGFAVLQSTSGNTCIFSVKTHQTKELKISIDSPNLAFSEGLASFQHERGTGFIDTSGKVVIPPKYLYASNFIGGQSCVSSPDSQGNPRPNVIINKKGLTVSPTVSPTGLTISTFYGGYAIASRSIGKTGVVNRKFQFIIKPDFETLIPQIAEWYAPAEAWSLDSQPPLFYYAVKQKGAPPCVVSLRGNILFNLPKGVILPKYPPRMEDGVIVCTVWIDDNHHKDVYLNLQGKEVSAPYLNLSKDKAVTYRRIAPGALLKTINCGDNYFYSKLPDSGHCRLLPNTNARH